MRVSPEAPWDPAWDAPQAQDRHRPALLTSTALEETFHLLSHRTTTDKASSVHQASRWALGSRLPLKCSQGPAFLPGELS